MIFVTVGTHEDPFDRLVAAAEVLAVELGERVVVQRGTSHVATPHCESHELVDPDTFGALVAEARIVVTHAGPASIRAAWAAGTVPIVVPRDPGLGEHVDGHQLAFARRLRDRVHLVEDPTQLATEVLGHARVAAQVRPLAFQLDRADTFAAKLGEVVDDLVARRRAAQRDTLPPRNPSGHR